MPNEHVMIFTNPQERTKIKGLKKIDRDVDLDTLIRDTGKTEESLLRQSYLNHGKRLMTEYKDEAGNTVRDTLKGLIFPATEIAKIINNQDAQIASVYIEFCHHGELSGKDEFSIMITGLDVNDRRIKKEDGESRVYEFAQSCPTRCPK